MRRKARLTDGFSYGSIHACRLGSNAERADDRTVSRKHRKLQVQTEQTVPSQYSIADDHRLR